jgi:hypothetical protein
MKAEKAPASKTDVVKERGRLKRRALRAIYDGQKPCREIAEVVAPKDCLWVKRKDGRVRREGGG